ncbi:MAG: hypothetical protein R2757_02560 [Draconibacterium sp.]
MFLNINNLNEGASIKDNFDTKKEVLHEGRNPKTTDISTNEQNWKHSKKHAHVNSNWEKLRK